MSILRSQPKWDLAPIPKNKNERLKALSESWVLDITGHPESLSHMGRIARQLFGVSVVAFSLLDAKTIKFITVESEENFGLHDIPRDEGICSHLVSKGDLLVVNDTSKDERFAQSPHVIGAPFIRFYAGVPISIKGQDGIDYVIGAFSLIDTCSRRLDMDQIKQFKDLSSAVDSEFGTLSLNAKNTKRKISL